MNHLTNQALSSSSFCHTIQHECITGSAIAPSLYGAAIRIIEDTGFWEPNRALNHQVNTFYQTRKPHPFGAIAAFLNEDDSLWQAKPQHRRPQKGKYEYPIGLGARAYLPPIPLEIRQRIGQRYGLPVPVEGSFWQWLAAQPQLPIVITEGGKKSLSLLSHGYVAIALLGVNAGVLKNETRDGEKVRRLHPELVPGLADFAQAERSFILAFDEDEKQTTRYNVSRAQSDLAFWLSQAGSDCAIAQWLPADGKGIDDLIVQQGAAYLERVIAQAQPWQQWQIQQSINHRLQREPQLHLGLDEFQHHAHQFPHTGLVALCGGKGTGKGKAIAQMLRHRPWLSVTTLRSLARDQAASWGGVFINQGDRHGDTLLRDGDRCSGGVVCVPSLLKTKGLRADVLVLDELPALQSFILSSKLANKNGVRPLLLEELEHRIQTAELVICASADLSEASIRWVEAIRGERAFLVASDRKPLAYPAHLIDGRKNQAIAQFIQHTQSLDSGKLTVFHSDSKSTADKVSALLLDQGIQSLLVTSDTSGGELESAFLASKGQDIPSLILSGVKAIITSPSVKEGFSIEHHTHCIDGVWGVFDGGSITPEAIAQTCDRVRALTPRYLWVAERGRAYSRLSRAETTQAFLRDFKRSSNFLVSITRRSLLTETEMTLNGFDWESPSMTLLAAIEVERNRGMKALRARVIALLEAEGKQIYTLLPAITPGQEAATHAALKAIRSRLTLEHAIAVEQRSLISEEQVQALESKEALTSDEKLDLEHYYLQQFYRAQITRSHVLWDNNGKMRTQIRNLESVLHPDQAEATSASSIDQTPTTPQDWNRTKLRQSIIETSNAATLIRAIVAGEVTELTPDRVTPIAQWIKHYAHDVAIAFNFRNIDKVSDRQAVFLLLDYCGIRRTSHRRRVNGTVERCYFVDSEHLEKLKTAMDRRSEADPPDQIIKHNQTGDTTQKLSPQTSKNSQNQLNKVQQRDRYAPSDGLREAI